jgi:hypothetical protein
MRSTFIGLVSLLGYYVSSAQLVITPGAQLTVFSDTKITLHNTDLINNGDLLLATTAPFSFTGDAPSFIGGDQAVRFFKLEINKTNNQSVSLQRIISAGSNVFLTSGFLNLNGFDLDLETTGHLDGEREDSRIIGANGGKVVFSVNLNSPTNSNPANLGVFITTGQDLGNVIIKRGHQSQANSGAGATVLRFYDILPTNNSNLNATIRLKYLDDELNGLNENSLVLLESLSPNVWTNLGFTSRDATTNFVERTGISSFGRFTLSAPDIALPVRFVSFNATCQNSNVIVQWKTSQEQNSSQYFVERSEDAIHWITIGSIPASGNSNTGKSYSFTDNNPTQNGYYRISEKDINGQMQYTNTDRTTCSVTDVMSIWPNPFHDVINIKIISSNKSGATIKLFDNKGSLVKAQKANVLQGVNQLVLDIKPLPEGVYTISIEWNNGQMKKALQVLKQ